jgi:aminomethyltransferase
VAFLQHALTNNAQALDQRDVGAQYTLMANEQGGAVDDAFLYRFVDDEFLLVVNAVNCKKDWTHLQALAKDFNNLELIDHTEDLSMLSLQGPASRQILQGIIGSGSLPEPMRNAVATVTIAGTQVMVARTGYTGEPLCFELFLPRKKCPALWDTLVQRGARPAGLGARDTLRLEAGLPLYGHELGTDPEKREIPVLACLQSKFAVSFSPLKGNFVGRAALLKQFQTLGKILFGNFSDKQHLPRMIRPVAVTGRGIARQGATIFMGDKPVGFVTSGTRVPYWVEKGEGLSTVQTDKQALRSICLAYIDSDILDDQQVTIEVRGKHIEAVVVPYHLRSEAPPFARPIIYEHLISEKERTLPRSNEKVVRLLEQSIENTVWRQHQCINLIPSEMTASPMVRLLSVMDPAFRYAEHKKVKAFYDTDIFYYQGTDFIDQVETLLAKEMVEYLGCQEVELRIVSGQMANAAVFSGLVDYFNQDDRKREPRRIRQVLNHYIGKGGHLSSQPMGALRDFVARASQTERPAVVNFPVLSHNPFQIDVPATQDLIVEYNPELIVFGKSMVLHKEPIAEIRRFLDDQGIKAVIMYDMAHVLGLLGPHFQKPFEEGADFVTGSTHKTYFGTQRGVIGSPFEEDDLRYELWEAVQRRTFPGSLSNHHLGTLLGLLMAAYEMNHFKDEYQPKVISNAKAFARALKETGLKVLGDPNIDFTETHQVILDVGYSRGPEMAARLEANQIICNYQAAPDEEGFTASGALRMGVSEMTRFGMGKDEFGILASLIHDVVVNNATVIDAVGDLRKPFRQLQFCFRGPEYEPLLEQLHQLL